MRAVLLGGGHAHVAALRHLARHPCPALKLLLISREATSLYSGMLPGVLRGDYTQAQARLDVGRIAVTAGAGFLVAEAVGLDLAARRVVLSDGPPVSFDLLSLDIGGRSAPMPGTIPLRPIEHLPARIAALDGETGPKSAVVVVGGGPAGVELAFALAWRWRAEPRHLALLTQSATILPEAPAPVRAYAASALARAGITVRCGALARAMTPGELVLADGQGVAAASVLWATGAVAPEWLAGTGLAVDADGCVRVDASLRSLSHPFLLATGDCAVSVTSPRSKGGVWAVRSGPALASTLRALSQPEPSALPRWRPQRQALTIMGLGGGHALAWRGRFWLTGRAAWRWKDWLDRRWVGRDGSSLPS